jgi:hypothetical protein
MAERIVSPGVFTREKDLSFLPQGISEIGAAIIGPTVKGPAFTPTRVSSFSEYKNIFGDLDSRFYVPMTAQEYLKNAPSVTIVRILGLGGYQPSSLRLSLLPLGGAQTASAGSTAKVVAVLHPSRANSALDLGAVDMVTVDASADWNATTLTINSVAKTISFDTGSDNYVTKVFGSDPQTTNTNVYVYKEYKEFSSQHGFDNTTVCSAVSASSGEDFTHDYSVATTPYFVSQLSGGGRKNLFKIKSKSHGNHVNGEYKIAISDLTAAGQEPGSDWAHFTLKVLRNNPGENNDGEVMEEFTKLNFDEDSANYAPRRIGDRYVTADSEGKLTFNGDWPGTDGSVHIRMSDYASELAGINEALVPHGFAAVSNPTLGTSTVPSGSFITAQTNSLGVFDRNVYYGWEFAADNNKQYLAPLPASSGVGGNVAFSLENMNGSTTHDLDDATVANGSTALSLTAAAKAQLKFVSPLQGGFDGDNPSTLKATGNDISTSNTQGFDCSGTLASGSKSYERAINAISNPDEYDINLLATPGVIHEYHSAVTKHAISKVEARADAFYVMDGSRWGRSVSSAVSDIKALDTNYAATYYPWVKVIDTTKDKPVWVPPSVVLPGVISFTDQVAHEWFAPAGLNRGGLGSVVEAKTRLTHTERDTLYEGRVNPIASFPGQGVVVFGQKTLQGKPSALDRINVRRLLIRLRKFIASSSRYLVFEQNTAATRNRFLGIVNPFLESVQANSGLSAFKVVMDDSNNTPDVVDRNELRGQIFIQPTRTAEFIVLDFVVQPTGAAFPE